MSDEQEIVLKAMEHELPVKHWLPNKSEKYADLGSELGILIWNDGSLDEPHNMTTYIIFRKVEHIN